MILDLTRIPIKLFIDKVAVKICVPSKIETRKVRTLI